MGDFKQTVKMDLPKGVFRIKDRLLEPNDGVELIFKLGQKQVRIPFVELRYHSSVSCRFTDKAKAYKIADLLEVPTYLHATIYLTSIHGVECKVERLKRVYCNPCKTLNK